MKRKIALMLSFSIVLSALAICIVPRAVSTPTTIWVPDDYPTIQQAVNVAAPGDTIRVRAGPPYNENVLIVGKYNISLIGDGATSTTISGVYDSG